MSKLNIVQNYISKSEVAMITGIFKALKHKPVLSVSFNEIHNVTGSSHYIINTTSTCIDCDCSIADKCSRKFDMSHKSGDYKAGIVARCLEEDSTVR